MTGMARQSQVERDVDTSEKESGRSKWKSRRWLVALVVAIAIPVGLQTWDHELEKTEPQRQALFAAKRAAEQAEQDKLYPKCIQTVKTEVTKADGSVAITERQVKVYCDKTPPEPVQAPWVKPVLIGLFVLLFLLALFSRSPVIFFPF